MTQIKSEVKTGKNFSVADLGLFSQLRQFIFTTPEIPIKVEGKVFLKEILNLSSAEISLNNLPPDTSIPFYHKHRLNEEVYIFLQGKGEFQVDDSVFAIGEGSIVRVDPSGERCMRNISATQDLCWIVIQSRVDSHPDNTIQDGFSVQRQVSWVDKQQI